MSESLDDFEAELKRLTPRRVSPELKGAIAERLDERSTFADRVLMTFMSAGTLAAALIVGLLLLPSGASSPGVSPAMPIAASTSPPASIVQYQSMLARSDGPGLEILR